MPLKRVTFIVTLLFLLVVSEGFSFSSVSSSSPPTSTSCKSNVQSLKWRNTATSASFSPRYAFGVARTPKLLVLLGGMSGQSKTGKHNQTMFNDVWRSQDGKSWTLLTTSPGLTPRSYFSTAYFGGLVYVLGGAHFDGTSSTTSKNKTTTTTTVDADGQVWYASKPFTNFTKGIYQIKGGTTDIAPWGRRFAMATTVASDKIWLYGGMTIDETTHQYQIWQDLWYAIEFFSDLTIIFSDFLFFFF